MLRKRGWVVLLWQLGTVAAVAAVPAADPPASASCARPPAVQPSGASGGARPAPVQLTVHCLTSVSPAPSAPAPASAPPSAPAAAGSAPAAARPPTGGNQTLVLAAATLAGLMGLLGLATLLRALFPATGRGATAVLRLIGPRGPALEPPSSTRMATEFAFRRHWGSLGGESTGWSLSPRLADLVAGLVLAFGGMAMLWQLLLLYQPEAPSAPAPTAVAAPSSAPAAAGASATAGPK